MVFAVSFSFGVSFGIITFGVLGIASWQKSLGMGDIVLKFTKSRRSSESGLKEGGGMGNVVNGIFFG